MQVLARCIDLNAMKYPNPTGVRKSDILIYIPEWYQKKMTPCILRVWFVDYDLDFEFCHWKDALCVCHVDRASTGGKFTVECLQFRAGFLSPHGRRCHSMPSILVGESQSLQDLRWPPWWSLLLFCRMGNTTAVWTSSSLYSLKWWPSLKSTPKCPHS